MTPPELPSNEHSTTPPLQRIAIGAGTLIVVTLTVLAAIFLATEDLPDESPTAIVLQSPTIILSATYPSIPPATNTPPAPPTATPMPPPAPTATPLPPVEPTNTTTALPPTATHTPLPPTSTFTPLPPPPPTATSETAAVTPATPTVGVCQPPPTWVPYVVEKGDTLRLLAERTNTSVYELQQVNCLDTPNPPIGLTIYLPFTPPTSTVTNTPTPKTPSPTPTRTDTPTSTPTFTPTPTITSTPRPPEILDSYPSSGVNSEEIIMAVEGRYFRPDEDGFRAELIREGKNYRLALGDLTTSTGFEATIPKGLPPGQYDLRVVNPDDQFDFEPAVYESKAATPAPTSTPTLTPTSTLTPTP